MTQELLTEVLLNQERSDKPSGDRPKRGRPRKADVLAKKAGNRNNLGRPKGDQAIINEYRSRMLASPKSAKVLEKIYEAALDDGHKNQSAAWKLVMDRLLPLSYFEKNGAQSGRASVNIVITGVNGDTTVIGEADEAEDVSFTERPNEF
jgi:hypothetical protein